MRNSSKDLHKKVLGRTGERNVCKYLKKRGFRILKTNYTTPFGEADIVAKSRDGYTCFVEVKARETDSFGLPTEAVTQQKQDRYRKIAQFYCLSLGEEIPIRFDVASVYEGEIEYFEGAFL